MADIYLTFNESNLDVAKIVKQDVEACSNFEIALVSDSWEEEDEFMEVLPQAKLLIIITTATSNITTWIIDPQNSKEMRHDRRTKITTPPMVDISHSYGDGMKTLMYYLKLVTCRSRFHKSRPKISMRPDPPKEIIKALEQTTSEAEPKTTDIDQAFMMANALIQAGSLFGAMILLLLKLL